MNPQAQGEPQDVILGGPMGRPKDPPENLPERYVWEVPGRPFAVHVPLAVIDRMSAEIMRSYGANPKRNAEIGGVLMGSLKPGSPTIVRVEDFEVVPCRHLRGPSYVFTEEDCGPFEQAGMRPDAIGYFRSHTREGLSLAVEDVELLDHFFADPNTVALLVRPYATKAGVAGFFIRENETFPETTPLEFPFRRQELSGQAPAPRRSIMDRRPRRSVANQNVNQSADPSVNQAVDQRGVDQSGVDQSADRDPDPAAEPASLGRSMKANLPPPGMRLPPSERRSRASEGSPQASDIYSQSLPLAGPGYAATPAARTRKQTNWLWMSLSFLFLLFGMALGYEVALLTTGSHASSPAEFSLSLVISKTGQNLSVHWDRQALAIRASHRGVLEIEEDGMTKPVDLDAAQLQNGTLTYRNTTNDVHFRLTVFPTDQVRVTESAEWRQ